MKTPLLTAMLFGLVAVVQAQYNLPELSEHQLTGTWYYKAFVNNNNMTQEEPKQSFPVVVTALEEGKLKAKFTLMSNGQCIYFDLMMQKTEEPGRYTAFKGKVTMYIYELPVKDHYILYHEKKFFGIKIREGILIGSNPEENLEALEEFKKFAQHKGLRPENISMLEQREKCVPEHGNASDMVCVCKAARPPPRTGCF